LDVEHIGPGLHFVQEDNGPSIGVAIATWRQRHELVGSGRRNNEKRDQRRRGPIGRKPRFR
ncbi:MAG: hypothetical protein JWO75_6230, partial [Actinomycetia bacterium]|nr:hypothetical protein [Actinomycetes bacterium]